MDYAESATMTGLILGLGMVMFFGLICLILMVIAHWRMFTKAGEAGWKSLVPVYSEYIQFKIAWNTRAFWTYLILAVVMGLSMAFSGEYAFVDGQLYIIGEPNFICGILQFLSSTALLFYTIMLAVRTASSFGKGTMFGLGLVLLPFIFCMIIAFGSAEYRGPRL